MLWTCNCDGFCTGMCRYIRMEELVKSLFDDFLDVTEESEQGKVFHPTFITTVRALKIEPLNKLIAELKSTVDGT